MSNRSPSKLPKWPFFLGDALLVGTAYLLLISAFAHGRWPMSAWENIWCVFSLALGCVFGVSPFLLEYRAAMKLSEADRLTNAVLQIENLEIIARQITHATAGWQTAHEHANKSVEASREIAERITTEARAFSEFLKKANDTEKNHLRLEVDKLRRSENEWLQILVRVLDHIFALYQAAVRSGQGNLVEQLGIFQNACRDTARRVGLVPFVALPGEPYDSKVHQIADANAAPAGEARVAETVATGYSYQGQLLRAALVTLLKSEPPFPPEAPDVPTDEYCEKTEAGEERPQTMRIEPEVPAVSAEEISEVPQSVEPAQEFVPSESPETTPEGLHL